MNGATTLVNPVLWVQHRLAGGWKNTISLTLAYCVLIAVVAMFVFRADIPVPQSVVAKGFLTVMALLQGSVLILLGTGAARRVILRDFTTGMFDSHRLTPISGPSAMLGYIIGPNLTPLALAAANTLIGLGFCAISGHPRQDWLVGCGLQVVFALLLWTFSATAALGTKGKANLAPLLAILSLIGGWYVVLAVPGLSLLVYGGAVGILDVIGFKTNLGLSGGIALALPQFVVMGTVFWAGARKYRRPDGRAFPAWLGFLLLAEAAALGALGILVMPSQPAMRQFHLPDLPTQICFTFLVLTILAMLPVSAMAASAAGFKRRMTFEPGASQRRPMPPMLAPFLATFIISCAMALVLDSAQHVAQTHIEKAWYRVAMTAVELLAGLASFTLVMNRAYRRRPTAAVVGGLWFALVCIAPPLIDSIFNIAMSADVNASVTALTACSPGGAVICLWLDVKIPLRPGLIANAVLILALLILNRIPRAAAAPTPNPQP